MKKVYIKVISFIFMLTEFICLRETINLILRSSKYWLIVVKMYASSFLNPKKAKLFRCAYFFCRNIDDILDRDRDCHIDRIDYVQEILSHMNGEKKSKLPIVKLYDYVVNKLEVIDLNDKPHEDFRNIIEVMLFDYQRSKNSNLLYEKELEEYYKKTFIPVLNLALMISGSKYRGKDILDMSYLQGHLYSIRDLEDDLSSGIINLPKEIISERKVTSDFHKTNFVKQWKKKEIRLVKKKLISFKKWIGINGDKGLKKVCKPLITGIERYCSKFE